VIVPASLQPSSPIPPIVFPAASPPPVLPVPMPFDPVDILAFNNKNVAYAPAAKTYVRSPLPSSSQCVLYTFVV
jgi:hypothetical protein